MDVLPDRPSIHIETTQPAYTNTFTSGGFYRLQSSQRTANNDHIPRQRTTIPLNAFRRQWSTTSTTSRLDPTLHNIAAAGAVDRELGGISREILKF